MAFHITTAAEVGRLLDFTPGNIVALKALVSSSAPGGTGATFSGTGTALIIDTDVSSDCDDMAAFAIACAAQKVGAASIAAVIVTNNAPYVAGAVYQVLRYCLGANSVPIGQYNGSSTSLVLSACAYAQLLATGPWGASPAASPTSFPGHIAVARQTMAALVAAGKKATYVTIGSSTSLAEILAAPSDAISTLTGAQLFSAAVSRVVSMAGNDTLSPNAGPEYNVRIDPPGAIASQSRLRALSPQVPRLWVPFQAGRTPGTVEGGLIATAPPLNDASPVSRAYSVNHPNGVTRQGAWDPLAVLYAVGADRGLLVPQGGVTTQTIDATGQNAWSTAPGPDVLLGFNDHGSDPIALAGYMTDLIAAVSPGAAGASNGLTLDANGAGLATVPDAANLNPGGAVLDLRLRINTSSFIPTSAVFATLIRKDPGLGQGWGFGLNPNGTMGFFGRETGGAFLFNSSAAFTLATGAAAWLRCIVNDSTAPSQGLAGMSIAFYTATDATGAVWTQVGATAALVVTEAAGGTGLKTSTAFVGIGANTDHLVAGMKILQVQEIVAGATVLDIDFARAATNANSLQALTGQTVSVVAPAVITSSTPAATASNVSITYNGPQVVAPVLPTTTQYGTYTGDGPQFLADHAAWLGRPPALASVHSGQGSQADFRNSVSYVVGVIDTFLTTTVSVPLSWSGGSYAANAAILAECAAGTHNADYTFAAQSILQKLSAQDEIIVRSGWENNSYQLMPWSSGGHEADFIGAFRNLYTCFMAVSPKFRIVLCPNAGGAPIAATDPGAAFYHGVGLDVYHFPQFGAPTNPYLAFDFMLTRGCGLNELEAFATANNKWMCFPEVGVGMDFFGPYFELFYEWCRTRNVKYFNWWDSNGDYPSQLSVGSQLLANGATYRHLHNPTKYPNKPVIQYNLLQRLQDLGDANAYNTGYVGNGNVTRAPNTVIFDGGGNTNGNQQVNYDLNPAPAGKYLFAATFIRTAGTDTVELHFGGVGTDIVPPVILDTARLPMNTPIRIAVPIVLPNRLTQLRTTLYHTQGGMVSLAAVPKSIGLWQDTTTDPTPTAGIVAITPPPTLVSFAGAAGAPAGNQVLNNVFGGATIAAAVAGLDGSGAVVFDGSGAIGVLPGLGVRSDGLYVFPIKLGTAPVGQILIPFRVSQTAPSFTGYVLRFLYDGVGGQVGQVDIVVFDNGVVVRTVLLTGFAAAVPQYSVSLRINGNAFIAYVDDMPVGSCGDTTHTANGQIGLGAKGCGFTSIGFSV